MKKKSEKAYSQNWIVINITFFENSENRLSLKLNNINNDTFEN